MKNLGRDREGCLLFLDEESGHVYFGCMDTAVPADETEVAEPEAPAAPPAEAPPKEKLKPDEKESAEEIERRARKPPRDGPCKRCGQNKPINRLMLCYPCWVKTENEKKGWKEGQPHPAGCGCALDCRFENRSSDN